ncbi:alpha/beta fold hydrolase [Streptomyces sp. NPDC087440]|uniref:alpha/beta fold hydrolase n=1 Tax=Streptomyces sp. NPDC087440 TaxID=3365790 RepID=UPI0037F1DA87
MARIICVHGIGQQYGGEREQHDRWLPALEDGLSRALGPPPAGTTRLAPGDVDCVFYGDLFRPPGRLLAGHEPPWDAGDVGTGFEAELLALYWAEAARVDPGVMPPDARTLARTPRSVQAALNALAKSRFFSGIALRAMVADLRQVRRYLCEPGVRDAVQERVAARVTDDTRLLVGHSLGSVVAYEALAAHPGWPVRALLTLGSPLGIRHLVRDRLSVPGGTPGDRPGPVSAWTNIADEGDVVALVKDLRPLYGPGITSHLVHNGPHAHDAATYLRSDAAGRAIADACEIS